MNTTTLCKMHFVYVALLYYCLLDYMTIDYINVYLLILNYHNMHNDNNKPLIFSQIVSVQLNNWNNERHPIWMSLFAHQTHGFVRKCIQYTYIRVFMKFNSNRFALSCELFRVTESLVSCFKMYNVSTSV